MVLNVEPVAFWERIIVTYFEESANKKWINKVRERGQKDKFKERRIEENEDENKQ
jgi:hypothetical protein